MSFADESLFFMTGFFIFTNKNMTTGPSLRRGSFVGKPKE